MMKKIYSIFSICVFLVFSYISVGQNCDYDQSSLLFNLDECLANYGLPSETEYDEFTAISDTFPGGTILSVVGGHLYRLNGAVNKHSCTESYDSTVALCIGSLDSCIYIADSDKALRFDIKVELGTDGVGRLSGLSFYEAAAPTFSWFNNENSGPNNHPTKYALRVSVDNVTIFEEIDIETTPEYTLETFDFSDIPAFKVTEMTEFNFELLPYCLVGIESTVSAWDIDNIIITANTVDNANGGELTFSDGTIIKDICTGDGNTDIMNVNLSNNYGTSSAYIITNTDSIIIAYDAVFPFDFEGESGGTCLIWNISYYDSITNNIIGADINDITGCYDLSDPLTIIKNEVNGGTIVGGPYEFCVGDDNVDNINTDDIMLNSNIGANGIWVITDELGNIIALSADYSDVDFDESGIGTCLIRFLSYEDGLSGDIVGNNIIDLQGCFALSNTIVVMKNERPDVTINHVSTLCGDNNGSASASSSIGQAPFTYTWSNGTSGISINNLAAGEYTVTVSDANGCSNTESVNIEDSTSPTVFISPTGTTCGEDNGSAIASAINGTAPYIYAWSNGMSGTSINNLPSGNYLVTVTDTNGCTGTSTVSITPSNAPESSTVGENTSCGEDNGSATASATGSQAPYTYIWNTGSTNINISDLSAGNYRVTVTDANGCTDWADIDIDPSTSPEANATATPTTCGEDNGTATVETTSGISPYSYAWSNGSSEQNIAELAAGTYTVTVTDSEGCTTTASSTVGNSTSPEATTNTTDTECGEDNGSATVNATSGTAPYTYTWSNGSSSATIDNLSSGNYGVTVTDAAGCTTTSSASVGGSSNPTATTTVVSNTSCGENNGAANVTATNGTAPYSYAWSNGSTTTSISGLAAGTYTVTVTDAEGCTTTTTASINESTSPDANATSTATTCGEDNGTATVETTSGISPYSYAWSNGSSEQNIAELAAGTYTVTVTDIEGCTTTASSTVGNSTSPEATTNNTDTECGEENGSATVNATSGTAPYTYTWSNGSSSATIDNLSSGNYGVTVTDAAGCTVTSTASIGGSSNPTATTTVVSNTSCGENNGAANVTAANGTAPYSYAWSNGSTTTSISGLAAGTYTVTVTDAEGCTYTTTASINESTSPEANATSTPTTCGEDNGTATVETTSGISPYTYAWSNGSSEQNIAELAAGTYTVTVTDSEGCVTTASSTVGNSTSPEATTNTTATECGEDNGSATVNATSGTAPYTYTWSNGSSSATINNLSSGNYGVTVTDAAGCTATSTSSIGGSSNPTATTTVVSNTSCGENNGAANVTATNGTAPYSYAWSNGSTTTSISGLAAGTYTVTVTDAEGCTSTSTASINESTSPEANASSTSTTCGEDNGTAIVETTSGISPYSYAWSNGSSEQNIAELAAGTYTVTVTDIEGCTTTASSTVGNSTSPEATTNITDTECGEDNGSATVNATSGTAPYSYTWSNGSSSATINNLSSGNYGVTVTDAAGCTVTSSASIGGSSNPTATTTVVSNTSCGENNGAANVTATNGTVPYSYAWSNGSTTTSISGLAAGTYTVTVTDAEGCTYTTTATINESTSPEANATSTATTCGEDNGTAIVETTSGISPYSYAWSNGSSEQNIAELEAGTYTVTVTDNEGCTTTDSSTVGNSTSPEATTNTTDTGCGEDNGSATVNASSGTAPYSYTWSNGSSSATINNLSSGNYGVTVTDAAGCTATSSASIGGSSNPTATTTVVSNTSCGENNGAANVTATNGTAPYSYAWSNGSTTTSISGLSAGTYTVTVTDAEGCTNTTTASINESTSPDANATSISTTCGEDNGTATVETTSGISPYTYAWSNGSSEQNIAELAAGTYTVTVTDNEGCTTTDSSTVGNSTSPEATTNTTDTECGEENGSATVNATSGTAPYSYTWSNGSSSATINNLSSGNYGVTVTDAAGCTTTSSASIGGSSNPTATTTVVSNTSCGENNGAANVTATNGTAPYSYAWSNGSTTTSISGLAAGTYTVTVTDAEGCNYSTTASINESTSPEANATSTPTTCGEDNGTATVETTSGISPYTYAWSNGSSEQNIAELAAGTYTVTVTDIEGCTTTASSTVGNSTSPEATTNTTDTECGEDNGSATVNATSGTAPYTYTWSNGSSSATIDNLSSGNYGVTVTDAAGCTATSSASIDGSSNPTATTTVVSNTSCGENNGAANVTATNGTAPYSYAWSNGSTTTSISGLAAGTYTVTVTDAEGCTYTTTATINESTSPEANATSTSTTCGEDNGTATVETTSGISPYTYAWSNGSSEQNIAELAAGTYIVTVTDIEGCTDQATINIEESLAAITEVSANATTCGENNGTAIANPIEGLAPYTYSWSTGANTQMIGGLEPGNYSVTMTDALGCTDEGSVQVEGSSSPLFLIESTPEECGLMNGIVTMSFINSGIFTVLWSNGSTAITQTELDGGTYSVTVTDNNGCTSEASIDIADSVVPDGGEISIDGETSVDFCLEGTMDMLEGLTLINEIGMNMIWIITNEDGIILHLLDDNGITAFDFEGQNIGTCHIYHTSYEEAMNIMVGNNLSEISGCYDLSNAITVTKYEVLMSSESSLIIDMDMCAANTFTNEPQEYTEFIANVDNDENCATLSVLGGSLYRNNPDINSHSCTEGVNGSVAMCVSSDENCDYNSDSDKAITLDIEVDPAAVGNTRLTKLSFFEKSPITYDWIDGDSGINNYPTKFGVRVLRGTDIVFEESDITTLQDWNERSYIFTGDDFLVTETTTFTIELLAYCVIGNGEIVTAWDIDDLSLVTECDNIIEAGTLSGGPYEICRDGQPDYITDVTLDGAVGDIVKLVLVDETDNSIIANFDNLAEFSTFDFESLPVDTFNLYTISAEPGFSGCDVGNIFKIDFEGCYKISNSLIIQIITCGSIVTAYPNPTNDIITLSNIHTIVGEKTISVYDAMGKLVKSYIVPGDVVSDVIDLTENHPGLYTIQIIGTSGNRVARSVIKFK